MANRVESAGPADPRGLSRTADSIFAKYASVWLWSILFSGNGVLGWSFGMSSIGRWNAMAGALVALRGVGGLVSIAAVSLLIQYLRIFLIPLIFRALLERDDSTEEWKERMGRAGRLLSQAASLTFLAVTIRVFESIVLAALVGLGL